MKIEKKKFNINNCKYNHKYINPPKSSYSKVSEVSSIVSILHRSVRGCV